MEKSKKKRKKRIVLFAFSIIKMFSCDVILLPLPRPIVELESYQNSSENLCCQINTFNVIRNYPVSKHCGLLNIEKICFSFSYRYLEIKINLNQGVVLTKLIRWYKYSGNLSQWGTLTSLKP